MVPGRRRGIGPGGGVEARAERRVDCDVEVSIDSEHNFYTGLSENLSAGGLFIATHVMRPVGTRLRVRFTLPGRARPIESEAEVRWVRDAAVSRLAPGLGVRFLELSHEDEEAVGAFIERRETIFFDDE